MSKNQAIQISIPQPCSEDWQQMTPQEQGRFCDSCKKCVIDFTGFTDGQLYQYFKQHAGETVCGHFKSTQLNRAIALPPQPHSKLYRIAIALGLAIAVVATSNTDSFAKAPLSYYTQLDSYTTDDSTKSTSRSELQGQIVDEYGEPMVNCAVEIVYNGVLKTGTTTDYDGNYTVKPLQVNIEYEIRIKYIGYKTAIQTGIILTPNKATIFNYKMKPSENRGLSEFVFTGGKAIVYPDPSIQDSVTSKDLESLPVRGTTTIHK